jgi:hypothetical protein
MPTGALGNGRFVAVRWFADFVMILRAVLVTPQPLQNSAKSLK